MTIIIPSINVNSSNETTDLFGNPVFNFATVWYQTFVDIAEALNSGGTHPVGPAGGDLGGTYPNPTVIKFNGATVGVSTPTNGNIWIANGTSWNSVSQSGDVTFNNTGASTIGDNKVTYSKLAADAGNGIVTYNDAGDPFPATLDFYKAGVPRIHSNGSALGFTHVGGAFVFGRSSGNGSLTVTIPSSAACIPTFTFGTVTVGSWKFDGNSNWTFPLTTPGTSNNRYCTSTTAGAMSFQQIAESHLAFTDITTNNATTSAHGFLKKLDNTATHYMDGTGNWSTPNPLAGQLSSTAKSFLFMGA